MNQKLVVMFLIVGLSIPSCFGAAAAQEQPKIADKINDVLTKISPSNYDSTWGALYSQIFGLTDQSIFDSAIQKAVSSQAYSDVIFIARLAELNGYHSEIINSSLRIALTNFPMICSLPMNYNEKIIVDGITVANQTFLLYDRYLLNGYRYAQYFNLTNKWNVTQAYIDFTTQYLKPPMYSSFGEMSAINPVNNFSICWNGRYYDEHAQTLSAFLEFANLGVNGSLDYADDVWIYTQSHWTGQFYEYIAGTSNIECEMGAFAQIIQQYQNMRGNTEYFNRVISDLKYKLLSAGFQSPGWGAIGVTKHADDNNQLRLYETFGNLVALQTLYSNFDETGKQIFQAMLKGDLAWQGLVSSPLSDANRFRFFDVDSDCNPCSYEDDASMLGAMTLFLYGIVPQTGHLVINASDERYQDYRTSFLTSQWGFNYQNHTVRVPITKGSLTFIYGSTPVQQSFFADGVYDIQFSSDWNTVVRTTKIANISLPNSSTVEIKPFPRANPYPIPTVRPSPTPTPSSTAQESSIAQPTVTPTQASKTPETKPDTIIPVIQDNQTLPSPQSTQEPGANLAVLLSRLSIAISVSVLVISLLVYLNAKRKKPKKS